MGGGVNITQMSKLGLDVPFCGSHRTPISMARNELTTITKTQENNISA